MLSRTLTKRRTSPRSLPSLLSRMLPVFVNPVLPWCTCSPTPRVSACARRVTMTFAPATSRRGATAPSLDDASPTPSHPPPTLSLTAQEAAIFALLSRVRKEEQLNDLTLRVAGGWVRDKVLGRAMGNVDIDIALDSLLGREFAEIVNAWMAKQDMQTTSVGVIQRNPDQSKHLETATMRVLGVWLDLVNLRTETYSHDSRIPDMAIGTPLEDAMRRDLTINALFYNINTGVVEDLTGRGIDDIRARIVRTPLPPLTTLLDDPLRALRAIRFASRLNFSFDSALFDACLHPDVHHALDAKVSRERVASEMDGIMRSDRPTHALGLLAELGLFPIVFRLPTSDDVYVNGQAPPKDFSARSLGALLNLEALWNAADDGADGLSPLVRRLSAPPADARISAYAAVLSPLAGIDCLQGRRKKPSRLVQYVLGEQLRMSSRDVSAIISVHDAALRFVELASSPSRATRLEAGLVLREAGPRWRAALQVAVVAEMEPAKPDGSYARGVNKNHRKLDASCLGTVQKYAQFLGKVEEFDLEGVWETKPCIDGREMFKLLPGLKKGPVVGQIMQRQIEWMITHPNAGMEDARQWLVDNYDDMK